MMNQIAAPAPKRRKSARRAEILRAARQVFLARQYEEAAVAEIAHRADCVEGTIYTYFKSKRELFDSVIAEFYDELIADIGPRFASIDGTRDRLNLLIARHLQIAVDDPSIARLTSRHQFEAHSYFGSPLHGLNRRYTQFMMRTIRDGIERGELRADLDPALARDVVFGGLEHIVWNALGQGRRIEPARTARELADMLLAGWQAAPPQEASDPVKRLTARVNRIEDQLKRKGLRS